MDANLTAHMENSHYKLQTVLHLERNDLACMPNFKVNGIILVFLVLNPFYTLMKYPVLLLSDERLRVRHPLQAATGSCIPSSKEEGSDR